MILRLKQSEFWMKLNIAELNYQVKVKLKQKFLKLVFYQIIKNKTKLINKR